MKVVSPENFSIFALTLVVLNKFRCHAYFQFSANQITGSRLLIQIHILNDKQRRSRSVGFFRSQLIWIYTICKGRICPGTAGQGLTLVLLNLDMPCLCKLLCRSRPNSVDPDQPASAAQLDGVGLVIRRLQVRPLRDRQHSFVEI